MGEVYDELDARLYDAYSTGLPGDVEFYVDEAKRAGGEVLELGCGTGRIVLPTAEAGVDVTGLDASKPMLKELRRKLEGGRAAVRRRVRVVPGDMRDFSLGRRFRLVTIPFRAFLHNLTVEDQLETLGCCLRHLEPGGRLILNVFDPRLDLIVAHTGPLRSPVERYGEFKAPGTGLPVVWLGMRHYVPETQLIHEHYVFERLDRRGRVLDRTYHRMTLRWVYRYELQHLLELAGFAVEALHGDFERGPFKYGGEQIWTARPRGRLRSRCRRPSS